MKVLIDTNVILDFFLARQPRVKRADELFKLAYEEKIEAFVVASSITDIYYVTNKILGKDSARAAIMQLLKMLTIIAVDGNDCDTALRVPIADYEDALVATCAKKESIDYIVTNDAEFIKANIVSASVITPIDFLNLT